MILRGEHDVDPSLDAPRVAAEIARLQGATSPDTTDWDDRNGQPVECAGPLRWREGIRMLPHASRTAFMVVLLMGGMMQAQEPGRRTVPRVVNGVSAPGFYSVGAVVAWEDGHFVSDCTGTLIGCRTVLTAANCFCGQEPTGTTCISSGLAAQAIDRRSFYTRNGGFSEIDAVVIHPDYRFGEGADLAILHLRQPAHRIVPSRINETRRLETGIQGGIAGFGTTGGDAVDSGLMRAGAVTLSECGSAAPPSTHVCWDFSKPLGRPGEDSNACVGDSGGPLFVLVDGEVRLAGVIAGGTRRSCLDSHSFNTDVFVYRDWIRATAGGDLGRVCGGPPYVGQEGYEPGTAEGRLDRPELAALAPFTVPPGTTELLITMNGEDVFARPGTDVPNHFILYVRYGAEPTESEYDCGVDADGPYAYCRFVDPLPGSWYALLVLEQGTGDFQLNVTMLPAEIPSCAGDCSGDGQVTVDEIITGVSVALGQLDSADCTNMDADRSGTITVDEILAAITNGLSGCS